MNNILLSKLQQFENNIKEYINIKFEEQHRLNTRTSINEEFSYDYFLRKESNDPDEVLIEIEDAQLLIDGIIEKFLDMTNHRNKICSELQKFSSLNLCRYFLLLNK